MSSPSGGSVPKATSATFAVDAGAGGSAVQLSSITIDYGDGGTGSLGSFTELATSYIATPIPASRMFESVEKIQTESRCRGRRRLP
jgi:hypothetical protein